MAFVPSASLNAIMGCVAQTIGEPPTHPEPWMVPREFESGGAEWMSEAARALASEIHPLLAQIPRERIEDVPEPRDGEDLPAEASSLFRPATVSHEWVASIEEAVNFDRDAFWSSLYVLADAIGGQMSRTLLSFISEVATEHGNTVAADRNFYDAFVEALELVEMKFDEHGEPDMMLVLHPDLAAQLGQQPPTAEQQARIDAVVTRRREEWHAARRRRELP